MSEVEGIRTTERARPLTLRIAGVVRESIVDGAGIRFAIFCQGCPHRCKGCHNPDTHDFAGGYDISLDRILEEIDKDPLLQGVTFSGGEPSCQPFAFQELARRVKARGLNVWMYSGYTLEELIQRSGSRKDPNPDSELARDRKSLRDLLREIDVLIDGRYDESQRDLTLKYRGSRNQRVIDMRKTRETGTLSLWEE